MARSLLFNQKNDTRDIARFSSYSTGIKDQGILRPYDQLKGFRFPPAADFFMRRLRSRAYTLIVEMLSS
jgi:hypothetical protein